jgi:hypothetical protein
MTAFLPQEESLHSPHTYSHVVRAHVFQLGDGQKQARALFDRLDTDKDGWLHYNDFVASLGTLTKELSAKEVRPHAPIGRTM